MCAAAAKQSRAARAELSQLTQHATVCGGVGYSMPHAMAKLHVRGAYCFSSMQAMAHVAAGGLVSTVHTN